MNSKKKQRTHSKMWVFEDTVPNEVFDDVLTYLSDGKFKGPGYSAALVFEEAFMNISNHAYENQASSAHSPSLIKVSGSPLETEPEVEMTFVDFGAEFDPTKYDYTAKRPGPGGEGIKILHLYSRLLEYERVGEANVLHVIV